ncbi:MAG: precorrin-3B C(17)-methyltransferase, partial [Pseudomonadota bacterium]
MTDQTSSKPGSEPPAIIVISPSGMAVAEEIKALSDGKIHGLKGRVDACDVSFDDVGEHLAALFVGGTTIVGVMASGALVRMVAPHLRDKHSDP